MASSKRSSRSTEGERASSNNTSGLPRSSAGDKALSRGRHFGQLVTAELYSRPQDLRAIGGFSDDEHTHDARSLELVGGTVVPIPTALQCASAVRQNWSPVLVSRLRCRGPGSVNALARPSSAGSSARITNVGTRET